MKKIDLHIHSCYSDGEASPKDIKNIAKKLKILITGESNWHGFHFSPNIKLGYNLEDKYYFSFLKNLKV